MRYARRRYSIYYGFCQNGYNVYNYCDSYYGEEYTKREGFKLYTKCKKFVKTVLKAKKTADIKGGIIMRKERLTNFGGCYNSKIEKMEEIE